MEEFKKFITIEKNLNLQPDILMIQSKLNRLMFDQMNKFVQEETSETLLEFIFENAYDHNDWDSMRVSDFFSRMYNTIDQLHEKDFEIKIYLILLFKRNVKSEIQFFLELMNFFSEFKNLPHLGILNLNHLEVYKSEFTILRDFFSYFGDLNRKFVNKTICSLSVVIFEILSQEMKFDPLKSTVKSSKVISTALRKNKLHRSILKVRIMIKIEMTVNEGKLLKQKLLWTQKLVDLNSMVSNRNSSFESISDELKTDLIKHFSNNEYNNLMSLMEGISETLGKTKQEFQRFAKTVNKSNLPHLVQLLELKERSDLKKMKFEVDNYDQNVQDLKAVNLRLNALAKDILFTYFFKLVLLIKIEKKSEHDWPRFERNEELDKYVFGFLKKTENEIKNDFKKLVEKRETEIEEIFQKIKNTQFMDDFVDFFKNKVHKIGPQTRLMTFLSSERKSARMSENLLNKALINRKTQQILGMDEISQKQKPANISIGNILFSNANIPFTGRFAGSIYELDVSQAILNYANKQTQTSPKEPISIHNFDVYLDSIIGVEKPVSGKKIQNEQIQNSTENKNNNNAHDQIVKKATLTYLDSAYGNYIEKHLSVSQKENSNNTFESTDNLSKIKNGGLGDKMPVINIKSSVQRSSKIQNPPTLNMNSSKVESNPEQLQVPNCNLKPGLIDKYPDIEKSKIARLSNSANIPMAPQLDLDHLSKHASNLNLNFKKSKIDYQFGYEQVGSEIDNNQENNLPDVGNCEGVRQLDESKVIYDLDHRGSQKLMKDLLDDNTQDLDREKQDSNARTGSSKRISTYRETGPAPENITIRQSLTTFPIGSPMGMDLSSFKRNTMTGEIKPPQIEMISGNEDMNKVPKFEYTPRPSFCKEAEDSKAPMVYLPKTAYQKDQLEAPNLDLRGLQNSNVHSKFPVVSNPRQSLSATSDLLVPEFDPKCSTGRGSIIDPPVFGNNRDERSESDQSKTSFNGNRINLQLNFNEGRSSVLGKVEQVKAPKMDWKPKQSLTKNLAMLPDISLAVRSSLVQTSRRSVVTRFGEVNEMTNQIFNEKSKQSNESTDKNFFVNSSINQSKTFIIENTVCRTNEVLEPPQKLIIINRTGNQEVQAPIIPRLSIREKSDSCLGEAPRLSLKSMKKLSDLPPPDKGTVFKFPKPEDIRVPKIDVNKLTETIAKYETQTGKNALRFNENSESRLFNRKKEEWSDLARKNTNDSEHKNSSDLKQSDKNNFDKENDSQKQTHLLELRNFHRSTLTKNQERPDLSNEAYVQDVAKEAEEAMKMLQLDDSELLETSTMFLNMEVEEEGMIVDLKNQYNEDNEFPKMSFLKNKSPLQEQFKKPNEIRTPTHLLELNNFHKKTIFVNHEIHNEVDESTMNEMPEEATETMKAIQINDSNFSETLTLFLIIEVEDSGMITDLKRQYNEENPFTKISFKKNKDDNRPEAPSLQFIGKQSVTNTQQAPKIKLNLEMLKIQNEKMRAPKIGMHNLDSKRSDAVNAPVLTLGSIKNIRQSMTGSNIDMPQPTLAVRFLKKKHGNDEVPKENLRMSSMSDEHEIENLPDDNSQRVSSRFIGQPIIDAPKIDFRKSLGPTSDPLIAPVLGNPNKKYEEQIMTSILANQKSECDLKPDIQDDPIFKELMKENQKKKIDTPEIDSMANINAINERKESASKFNLSGYVTNNSYSRQSQMPSAPVNIDYKPRSDTKKMTLTSTGKNQFGANDFEPPSINMSSPHRKSSQLEITSPGLNFVFHSRKNEKGSKPIDPPDFSFENALKSSRVSIQSQKIPVAPQNVNIRNSLFEKNRKPEEFSDAYDNITSNPYIQSSENHELIEEHESDSESPTIIHKKGSNLVDSLKVNKVKQIITQMELNAARDEIDSSIRNVENTQDSKNQSDLQNTIVGKRYVSTKSMKTSESSTKLSKKAPVRVTEHEKIPFIDYESGLWANDPSHEDTEIDFLRKCVLVFVIFNSKSLKRGNQRSNSLLLGKQFEKVFWTPVENSKITGSVWEQIKNFNKKIDLTQLCELFEDKSTSVVDLIRGRNRKEFMALQTINIFGSNYHNFPKLFKQLWTLDFQKTDLDFIQNLLSIVPTTTEILAVAEIKNKDVSCLNFASKWILVASSVPHLAIRLESYLLKQTIAERIKVLNGQLNTYTKICQIILEKGEFQKFLKTCIDAGNRLNLNSELPQILGFKLSALNALVDCESQKQISLLEYLIYEFNVQDKGIYDSLKSLVTEIEKIRDYPLKIVTDEILKMKSTLNEVRLVLEESDNSNIKDEFFTANFKTMFIKHAKSVIDLENKAVIANDLFEDIFWFLGDDDDLFESTLVHNDFLKNIGNCLKEGLHCQI